MATEIAHTILQQMGGARRLAVMTGAKNFLALPDGVSFRLGRGAKHSINVVTIKLNGLDLYDITFSRLRAGELKEVSTETNVYFDQLKDIFECRTGMYLSL